MLYDKIQELCRKKKTNFAQLERALGFGNGTLHKWESSIPGIDKVQSVAKYFGITVDELLGTGIYKYSDDAKKIATQFDELPEDRKNLLKCYLGVIRAG